MEFIYGDYYVRYILNPTDFILRLEDKKTGKLYEETHFERDFAEYKSVGGLEFVSKLIAEALAQKNPSALITKCCVVDKNLELIVQYTNSMMPKPLDIVLALPQKRRDSASEDLIDMSRKLRKLDERKKSITDYRVRNFNMSNLQGGPEFEQFKTWILQDGWRLYGISCSLSTYNYNVSYNYSFTSVKSLDDDFPVITDIKGVMLANNHEEFQESVKADLNKGWSLYGNLLPETQTKIWQLLVKYE